MLVVDDDPTGQRSPASTPPGHSRPPAAAKLRVLDTADRLFYNEGIRAVGVDRLISESAVTKATFYKHYGSKDQLVVEYLRRRHQIAREFVEGLQGLPPRAAVQRLVDAIIHETLRPGFRGCAFVNAAMEFMDAQHPVRLIVTDHRDWYAVALAELLGRMGHPLPGDGADEFVLARDGAMTGGQVGDPVASAAAFRRVAARLISEARG